MAHLKYYHINSIELIKEVRQNRELYELLKDSGAVDVNEGLGHIAAYLNIALDGAYSQEDLDVLSGELALKLRKLRTSLG